MKTYVIMNDIQIPFEDKPVLEMVVRFVETLKPFGIVLNGDVLDCYDISQFDKDPNHRGSLLSDIKKARRLMERLAKVTTERVWLGGNHEDRLRKYVWENAPALGVLPALDFAQVVQVADYGFAWRPWGEILRLGKLIVTHGFLIAQASGVSAKRHFERLGTSVLIGHTHRLGIYYRTNMGGTHAAYENGCLCSLRPQYVQYPDWQHGFSIVHVDERTGTFHVQQIPIIDRKVFYYGKERITR